MCIVKNEKVLKIKKINGLQIITRKLQVNYFYLKTEFYEKNQFLMTEVYDKIEYDNSFHF